MAHAEHLRDVGQPLPHEFGVTPEQLAKVSVKNHRHAAGNARAQHPRLVTVEEVLARG